RLPLAVLRSLRPGDVLLDLAPAALGAARAGPLHAWWGARRATQWHATVLIEGTTMTMIEIPDTADDLDEPIVAGDMPAGSPADSSADAPDDDAPGAAPEPADLGDVDLPVHVEIDTLSLSIAELAALRPGYVLELPLAARDVPVRL
ncbi:type III secretion system cytoplasmic ring protein SctQ, partial [Burkholderia ubonensis]